MKTTTIFLMLSVASMLIMIVVDYIIGWKAEFLNAYSVLQRLVGQEPAAGASTVARKLGSLGGLGVVVLANLAIGGVLTATARLFIKG